MTETSFIQACKKGDIEYLKEMSTSGKKLSTKSRSKEYDNLLQRGLFEMLGTLKEREVARVLVKWSADVNELISEKQVLSLLAKNKYEVLDELMAGGYNVGKVSVDTRYKSIFDRMLKESLKVARVDDIEYLMNRFNMDWVNVDPVIRWLANQEAMASHIDKKLNEKGYPSVLNFLIDNGVSMEKIIKVLN